MNDPLGELQQMSAFLGELTDALAVTRDILPQRSEGTDRTGSVTVVLDPDDLPLSIVVAAGWQQRLSPDALGGAAVEAGQAAAVNRLSVCVNGHAIPQGKRHVIPQALGVGSAVPGRPHDAHRAGGGLLWHRPEKLSRVSVSYLPGDDVSRDDQPVSSSTVLSLERIAEIDKVIDRITRWARDREDVVGLLLVGSCARNAARPDSDIDIVLLTTDEPRYLDEAAWAGELGLGELIHTQAWGPITEKRFPNRG
ncbi:nucleotidyltransferase domain-containing protein [Kitasatospora aureofaciens]|uniref:Polymerase nucleotidyl transferase domain-containing protein n=1 Tax=Kitasatospora aureofaciens TaxID=1894 RepID=A0A8H9HZ14_KITAU|nr:nucleotidyltransferase domain-containing protein [Kitasatospora aureofaciens]GGV04699.1 hypothetical protein GCM10010502_69380 [Kitasatospora aureofaciens]